MRKNFTLFLSLFLTISAFSQFTPGNLVVVRVGTGLDSLSSFGSPVFLDEYTPTGTLVSSVAMPTTVVGPQKRFILNGYSSSEGMIQRSPNGLYLTFSGYDTSLGGAKALNTTLASSVNRSIARVDYAKSVDVTTALSDYSSNGNPRDAVTTDGTKFWVTGGSGGVRYATLGASTSTQVSTTVANLRGVNVAGDQLYISTQSGAAIRIGTVGTGLPENTGNTITNLPGMPTTTSPYQFVFFDLNAAVPGPDVLYVASDDASALQKFSLVGGTWTSNGIVGVDNDYRGLTGDYAVGSTGVVLYATRKGGSTKVGGGELVSVADASGYNGAFAGDPTILATHSLDSMAFRGVAMAPLQNPLPLSLLSFTASKTANGNLLVWTTNKEYNVSYFEVQKATDGASFRGIANAKAKGDQLYNEYQTIDADLTNSVVFYRLKMVDKDGGIKYSQVVKISASSKKGFSVRPNPASSSITVEHGLVKGNAVIKIVTQDGKQVAAYAVPEGSYQTSLNIGHLMPSVYRLVFENGTERSSSLLVKE